jgi:hypothetical protein
MKKHISKTLPTEKGKAKQIVLVKRPDGKGMYSPECELRSHSDPYGYVAGK